MEKKKIIKVVLTVLKYVITLLLGAVGGDALANGIL